MTLAAAPERDVSPANGSAPARGTSGSRQTRGAVGGLAATVGTYLVLVSGVLPALAAPALLVAVLLLAPSSADLGRRLALNGAMLIGWAPLLWWVSWPVPFAHGPVVVAAGTGALVWSVSGAASPRAAALGSLRPRCRPADGLVLVGGVGALLAMSRWAFPGSPRAALVALLPGFDNAAHYSMFAMLRTYGATTAALGPAPDGTPWSWREYPQGFHALVTLVSELMHPVLGRPADGLVAYTQGVAVLVVLGVVVVTACVVSLPVVRHRPLLACPAVVASWAAFLWSPGQDLLADGFGNFWLAAAAGGSALLLVLGARPRSELAEAAAVGGLLIAVADAWAPLLAVAAPAGLVLLLAAVRASRDGRTRPVLVLTVLLVAVAAVARVLWGLVVDVDVRDVVVATGGIHGKSPLPAFLLVLAGLVLGPFAPRWVGASRAAADPVGAAARRAPLLSLSVLSGAVVAGVLLVLQLRTVGTSSYYFLKFFLGFELVLTAFIPALGALLLCSRVRLPRRGPHRAVAWSTALVATVLASQLFGRLPGTPVPLMDPERSGTAAMGAPLEPAEVARGILAASAATRQSRAFEREYVALGAGRAARAVYPDLWFHALSVSDSLGTSARQDALRREVVSVADAAPMVRALLREHPRLTVVVAPGEAESLRRRLGTPALAARVVTWDDSAPTG